MYADGRDLAKRILRLPFWYTNRRLAALKQHLDDRVDRLGERVERSVASGVDLTANRVSAELQRELGDIHSSLESLSRVARRPPWADRIGASVDGLDELSAAFLNYALSDQGFAAQAGLLSQPPLRLGYREGEVQVLGVTSAVIEIPHIFRSTAGLPSKSSVLCLDRGQSLIALGLAAHGHRVTTLGSRDTRSYPNLVACDESSLLSGDTLAFDAVIVTSNYSSSDTTVGQLKALLTRLAEGAFPETRLILCVPYAADVRGVPPRVYRFDDVKDMTAAWQIVDAAYAVQSSHLAWTVIDGDALGGYDALAVISARLPRESTS